MRITNGKHYVAENRVKMTIEINILAKKAISSDIVGSMVCKSFN